MVMTTIKDSVAAAVVALNAEDPNWFNRIDLKKLDLFSCMDCILGQVFGSFHGGVTRVGHSSFVLAFAPSFESRHEIDAEWRRVVMELKAGQNDKDH